jgi:predicted nucleotidyltransferase
MKSRQEIQDIIQSHKQELFRKYPITEIGIFGSYARDEQTTESDVDILVDYRAPMGIEFIDLADELEELLGMKVDLVSKQGIEKKYLNAVESSLIYV